MVGAFLATVDATLQSAIDDVVSFFGDNLPAVIGGFIAVAGILWLLGLAFRSVGIRSKGKVG